MKRIAIEEHFLTRDFVEYMRSRNEAPRRHYYEDEKQRKVDEIWWTPNIVTTWIDPDVRLGPLLDIGEGRIKDMDRDGISMQVLSLNGPAIEGFDAPEAVEWAQKTNDELAGAVKKHPDRFSGLAQVPFQEPAAAAGELERAVKQLGLCGGVVNSHVRGEYLDNKKFWVVFEKAEKLGVPIYIHPREPAPDMIKAFEPYPMLWSALWGYGVEVGLHAIRLICSGLFDEFPRLKIIIGHMGEGLPYWLARVDSKWPNSAMGKKLSKKPSQYIKDNFAITTSGMLFDLPPLICAYQALGADNILFAVDYPHESNQVAVRTLDAAPICDSDKEKIYHLNAERLFSL